MGKVFGSNRKNGKKIILKNGMCKGKGGSGVSSLYGHINLWIKY